VLISIDREFGQNDMLFARLRRHTDRDSGCRKQHRQSLEVYGAFGIHAKGKGSSRSVVRVDRRANSERRVRRVLLPEFCTNRPENKPFPSNKLDTYQREYCGSFGSNG
jgi:hypothetical protein